MPNDAKLGLVLGVGIVIVVAVVYFRNEPTGATPNTEPAAAVQPAAPAPSPKGSARVARAKPTSRRHTVAEGETLFTLAERYYGDKARSEDIYQANRRLLRSPDALPPGTVLVIPDAAADGPPAKPEHPP